MSSRRSSSFVVLVYIYSLEASLTSLDLSFNRLGSEGAKALAEGVAVSASLTKIDVRYNNIEGDGASQLCKPE